MVGDPGMARSAQCQAVVEIQDRSTSGSGEDLMDIRSNSDTHPRESRLADSTIPIHDLLDH
jgi:hypothetical protein